MLSIPSEPTTFSLLNGAEREGIDERLWRNMGAGCDIDTDLEGVAAEAGKNAILEFTVIVQASVEPRLTRRSERAWCKPSWILT